MRPPTSRQAANAADGHVVIAQDLTTQADASQAALGEQSPLLVDFAEYVKGKILR